MGGRIGNAKKRYDRLGLHLKVEEWKEIIGQDMIGKETQGVVGMER